MRNAVATAWGGGTLNNSDEGAAAGAIFHFPMGRENLAKCVTAAILLVGVSKWILWLSRAASAAPVSVATPACLFRARKIAPRVPDDPIVTDLLARTLPMFPDERDMLDDAAAITVASRTGETVRVCANTTVNTGAALEASAMTVSARLRPTVEISEEGVACMFFTPVVPGVYTAKIFLLGDMNPHEFKLDILEGCPVPLLSTRVEIQGPAALPTVRCGRDFGFNGTWLRLARPECRPPICTGDISVLEDFEQPASWVYDTPWVYVPRECYLHYYSRAEATTKLNNTWIALWGDSNYQDMFRDIIKMTVDPQSVRTIPRTRTSDVFADKRVSAAFRISFLFVPGGKGNSDFVGLSWFDEEYVRDVVVPAARDLPPGGSHNTSVSPSVIFFNSGLHDIRCNVKPCKYDRAHYYEAKLREVILEIVRISPQSKFVWRNTVATAGAFRCRPDGGTAPTLADHFNEIAARVVREVAPDWRTLDYYDISYPFHWDNSFSDGGHFGRRIGFKNTKFNFVDKVLGQVHLNMILN